MGHAILERVVLFGTRSADYIRASGHGGCIATEVILQATIGRIHDRTRTLRRYVRFHLHRGHRPYMTHLRHWRCACDALQKSLLPSVIQVTHGQRAMC
jgi:hypothetical protein